MSSIQPDSRSATPQAYSTTTPSFSSTFAHAQESSSQATTPSSPFAYSQHPLSRYNSPHHPLDGPFGPVHRSYSAEHIPSHLQQQQKQQQQHRRSASQLSFSSAHATALLPRLTTPSPVSLQRPPFGRSSSSSSGASSSPVNSMSGALWSPAGQSVSSASSVAGTSYPQRSSSSNSVASSPASAHMHGSRQNSYSDFQYLEPTLEERLTLDATGHSQDDVARLRSSASSNNLRDSSLYSRPAPLQKNGRSRSSSATSVTAPRSRRSAKLSEQDRKRICEFAKQNPDVNQDTIGLKLCGLLP